MGAPDPDLLVEPAERELHAALERAEGRISAALQGEDFALAMAALAALRGPIDAFFDGVMVNVSATNLTAESFNATESHPFRAQHGCRFLAGRGAWPDEGVKTG